MYAKRSAVN